MIFSDLFFLYLFLPLCLICYYVTKNPRFRNAVLIVFSLIFYAFGEPKWILLLLFISVNDFFLAKGIAKYREKTAGKVLLGAGLIFDIVLLLFFKFSGPILGFTDKLFGASTDASNFLLPVGLSFFLFKSISYLLDVTWEKVEPEKNYFRYLLYISLFTQVVAGPIVRYADVETELLDRSATSEDLNQGVNRIVAGLAKKVIIADNLLPAADDLLGEALPDTAVVGVWLGVLFYTLYVFYDFAGYSDMAIGISRLFGFHIKENFNYPFVCRTIAEFWQRWHISLGSFFRDYLLYVPIFGEPRKYAGLFLVWFSTGLWHGSHWNYIIWGLYFGVFILIETLIGKKKLKKVPTWIMHIYTKLVLILGFGIFRFEKLSDLGLFFKGLVGLNGNGFIDEFAKSAFIQNAVLLALGILFCFPIVPKLQEKCMGNEKLRPVCGTLTIVLNAVLLIACSILLVNASSHPFLYANY